MYDCTINTQKDGRQLAARRLDAVVLHPYQAKIIAAMLSDKTLTIFLGRKCGVTYAERIAKQIKAEMDKMQNPVNLARESASVDQHSVVGIFNNTKG